MLQRKETPTKSKTFSLSLPFSPAVRWEAVRSFLTLFGTFLPSCPPWCLNTRGPQAAAACFFLSHHWEFPPFLLRHKSYSHGAEFLFPPFVLLGAHQLWPMDQTPNGRVANLPRASSPRLCMGGTGAARAESVPALGLCTILHGRMQPFTIPSDAVTSLDLHVAIHPSKPRSL